MCRSKSAELNKGKPLCRSRRTRLCIQSAHNVRTTLRTTPAHNHLTLSAQARTTLAHNPRARVVRTTPLHNPNPCVHKDFFPLNTASTCWFTPTIATANASLKSCHNPRQSHSSSTFVKHICSPKFIRRGSSVEICSSKFVGFRSSKFICRK